MEISGNKLSELFAVAFKKKACTLNDRVAVVITFIGFFHPKANSNVLKSGSF